MATKFENDEDETGFSETLGRGAGHTYGFAKDRAGAFADATVKAGKDVGYLGGLAAEKAADSANRFGSGFSSAAGTWGDQSQNKETGYEPVPKPAAPAKPAQAKPVAKPVNQDMPEPQPENMMADAQGYLPQDYVQPGMLARPDTGYGARPGADMSGAGFSVVSGPGGQNNAAYFNAAADQLAAVNKEYVRGADGTLKRGSRSRKGPAVYSNNAIPGDMSGGRRGGGAGGYQAQIAKMLSSMPYGNRGDRAKRNSILKQAELMMKSGVEQQKLAQNQSQFAQDLAFKQNNANQMAQQAAMQYAQKGGQFNTEMDFKRGESMRNQGNMSNQMALDYYKAEKTGNTQMPYTAESMEDRDGNSTLSVLDKRTGRWGPGPQNSNQNKAMAKHIGALVDSEKISKEEGKAMMSTIGY